MFRIEDTDAARNTQESYDTAARRHALARLRLGRGPRGRRRRTAPTASPSASTSTPTSPPGCARPAAPTTATAPPRSSTQRNAEGPRRGPCPRVRRPLPRRSTHEQRAAYEAEGRRPVLRLPHARRGDHLHRPGARRDHLPARARPRLRAGAGQRPPALHAGEPRRRRADGDHPRAARRGPAVLDAAPDRALRRARRHRCRHRRARRRSGTCRTSWAQGNKKLSKRDPEVEPARLPRPGLPARGPAQLPGAARLGDRRGPRHLLDGGDGRGVRHRAGQPQPGALRPQEGRGDQRRAPAGAARRRARRADGALPPAAGVLADAGHRRAARACCSARRRWSTSG